MLGHPVAWHNLGSLYYVGSDALPEDPGAAFRYFSVAARMGYDRSQGMLGHMMEYGKGTYVDKHEALKWYLLAEAQGNGPATERIAALKQEWSAADWEKGRERAAAFEAKPFAELEMGLYTHRKEVQPWPVAPRSRFSFFYMFNLLSPQDLSNELTMSYAYTIMKGDEVYLVSDVDEMKVKNGQTAILTLQDLQAGRTPGEYTIRLAIRCNGVQWIIKHPLLIGSGS
jgi:hypothetical protein